MPSEPLDSTIAVLILAAIRSMGSTSTAGGANKSATITPGQNVQQESSGGCC